MEKNDMKKELGGLYAPSARAFTLVDVPEMGFLMADGRGRPDDLAFQQAIEALYGVAYTIKFALKKAGGADFVVMPLEGLWWAEDMGAFALDNREEWLWTLMIAQPPQVTREVFEAAAVEAARKKDLPALEKVRFERFGEGRAAQILYIGSFAGEGPAIAAMHDFITAQGYGLSGKHHEIYLSDFRRTAPEKLRTILRQPVES